VTSWTQNDLHITILQDEDRMFIVECPDIPGCVSRGRTREAAEVSTARRFVNVSKFVARGTSADVMMTDVRDGDETRV
jgi:hypothetical protein